MKKKHLFTISILGYILLLFFSCGKDKDCHDLKITNNSSSDIYYYVTHYDSSVLKLDYNPSLSPSGYKCLKNTSINYKRNDCIESQIAYSPSKHIYTFIFDAYILEHTAWDTVKSKRLFLKRYDLDINYLKNNNFTVSYP